MPAKKSPVVSPAAVKPAVAKAKAPSKPSAAKPQSPASAKKPAAPKKLLTLKPKKNPKYLDRLFIPGATENIPNYDVGVPAWLFVSGLTIEVDKNWNAKAGDIITVGKLINPTTVELIGTKTLKPGEEAHNFFYFAASSSDLPDDQYALVYVVHYGGGPQYDMSYVLKTLVKTDELGGKDPDQIAPGHQKLNFSVSEKAIVPGNAHDVKVTVQPYENLNPTDKINLHWGHVIITQQVAGVLTPTDMAVTYQDIIDGGDSDRFEVWFEAIDLVGNVTTPGSASIFISVKLDMSKPDGPALVNAGPLGYVDLEVLAEQNLELQMFTPASIGPKGSMYDVTCRFYPPKGGVKVVHKFATIENPGRPVSVFADYLDVRATAEGRMDTSFVLRRTTPPFEIFSTKTTAQVKGSIVRLETPHVEGYPNDLIVGNPTSVIASIPYYAWRQPSDKISLILRYVRALNDVVVYIDTDVVGPSIPAGAPVKRVINQEHLQLFKGLRPEFYYVIGTDFTKARAIDLNESLRRVLTIM